MMMFDDKVGGWGWLNDDVIKNYTYNEKKLISVKTYLKSIYPFEDITDQFHSSDFFFWKNEQEYKQAPKALFIKERKKKKY